LQVDGLLCRSARSQARKAVIAVTSISSSVSRSGGIDRSSRK
jgi:hypothetical protein